MLAVGVLGPALYCSGYLVRDFFSSQSIGAMPIKHPPQSGGESWLRPQASFLLLECLASSDSASWPTM